MMYSSLLHQPIDWSKIAKSEDDLVWVGGGSRTKNKQAKD
jgi:heptaprenylglyceryl phosphate synthase